MAGDVPWLRKLLNRISRFSEAQVSGEGEASTMARNVGWKPTSSLSEAQVSGEDDGTAVAKEKLDAYLKYAEERLEAVQNKAGSESQKFNHEQCAYLASKLDKGVQSAKSFLQEYSWSEHHAKLDQNFKFLVVLAEQTEQFVLEHCCQDGSKWIQAALTSLNAQAYVSSVGLNLELCVIAFRAAAESLSLDELVAMKCAEQEIVRQKAGSDGAILLSKLVALERKSLSGEERELVNFLLQKLLRITGNSQDASDIVRPFEGVVSELAFGKGFSATVFKATWLGIPVARKEFFGTSKSRFLQEVAILWNLHHPNITSVYGYVDKKTKSSIMMELMDGDLSTCIQSRLAEGNQSPFPIFEAVDIMLQIGEGVRYLHENGIAHRNLRSTKILFKSAKTMASKHDYVHIKVSGFGISNYVGAFHPNRIVPSRIMAPELIAIENNSLGTIMNPYKIDVYSFAMVCYEILTGHIAFEKEYLPGMIKVKVLRGERPPLPTFCPARLKVLIERCWDTHPSERPSFNAICTELMYLKNLLLSSDLAEAGATEIPAPISELESQSSKLNEARDQKRELNGYFELLALKASEMKVIQERASQKFNNEKCCYLIDKLGTVVQSARLFLQMEQDGPFSREGMAKWVHTFKFVLALAEQVKTFVQECCCKDAWMLPALMLTNTSGYVSSLGFQLELGNIAFFQNLRSPLAFDEVVDITETEVKIVKEKAFEDDNNIYEKLELEKPFLTEEVEHLSRCLIQRLGTLVTGSASASSTGTKDLGTEDPIGYLYPGTFKPLQRLGSGATAIVYKALWVGTPVAQKLFHGPENPDFVSEVKVISKLCHPNIMSMFCYSRNDHNCSIVMELMDGDLSTLMQQRVAEKSHSPPFPISEAVNIMLQIGEGVKYLHDQRIVHRDLKSMNILVKCVEATRLVSGFVHAKVSDFGMSKTKQWSSTYSVMTCNQGTSRWMAPEVIQFSNQKHSSPDGDGKNHKFKCDVYSFAILCYEILTGHLPFFKEGSPKVVKEKVLKGHRPDLPEDCPPLLKNLIIKCWNQKPRLRPDFKDICFQLKYLQYLLITGNASKVASIGAGISGDELVAFDEEEVASHKSLDNISSVEEMRSVISESKNLTSLRLHQCWSTELPGEIGNLTALTALSLEDCVKLKSLPSEIGHLTSLTSLSLTGCHELKHLPREICNLRALTTLSLKLCSSLTKLPEELGKLTALKTLSMKGCPRLTQLPESVNELDGLIISSNVDSGSDDES